MSPTDKPTDGAATEMSTDGGDHPEKSPHATYLTAKRTLDDRSMNRDVLAQFAAALPPEPTILEVGAGTLTMVERLAEWEVLDGGEWVAVDTHEPALRSGRARLGARADGELLGDGLGESIRLGDLTIECSVGDAFDFTARVDQQFDAVVGCAFFDVVDPVPALESLGEVAPLVYAPITYDGETSLSPTDPDDPAVFDAYHQHMRAFRPGSPEGATALADAASTVIASAPSPWRIEPPYTDDDRLVLAHLLDTIESAVAETGKDISAWTERRRAAVASSDLTYIARNRDLLIRL